VYEALSYYKLKEKLEDRDTSAGEALSYMCMRPWATSVRGLKLLVSAALLVYEALSY
jgi:hypothetical protein